MQVEASYIMNGEGFIVVYSINDHYSFEVARQMVKLIKEVRKPHGECQVPVILVGNKRDLRRGRRVSKEEARETASEFSCSHYETSALTNRNVQIVFFNMVFQVRFTKKSRQKSQGSSSNNGFLSSVRQLLHRRGSLPSWWYDCLVSRGFQVKHSRRNRREQQALGGIELTVAADL